MRRRALAPAALFFMVGLATGCGRQSDQSSPTPSTKAQDSPSAANPPAAQPPAAAVSPQASGDRFRCVGNEPGWTLAISPDSLVFVGDYGEVRAAYPGVAPRTRNGTWYYETANRSGLSGYSHLTVMVVRGSCSDGMSDRRYEYTVRVIHDSKNYVGCGQHL
jgi:uncharacterized membrane protein